MPHEDHDATRVYTAWELAGDGWWIESGYHCQVDGERTIYEEVAVIESGAVRLARLDDTLHQFNRYVTPDTPMRLVILGPLTTEQAAQQLGITQQAVQRAILRGHLAATRFGREWMIPPQALELYRATRLGRPGPKPRRRR